MSTLHEASRDGDMERVKQLLDGDGRAYRRAGVDERLDEKDEGGRTALMRASENGHTKVVKLLLDKGASVDEKDERGRTALVWASMEGHAKVVKLLLDKGVSTDGKDMFGNTALLALLEVDEE